jgi:hypothetical protein
MTERNHIKVREEQANRYASREEFSAIFSEPLNELYQLSFLLTRGPAKAGRCLVSGFEDCVTGNRAFREWARSWAKPTIVQNAIRGLKPRPIHSNSPLPETILRDIGQLWSVPGGHFAVDAGLGREDFERFVFVLSVWEHYSERDCCLLLGYSAREIREAHGRALEELMDPSQRDLFQNQPFPAGEKMKMTHSAHSVLTRSHLHPAVGHHGNALLRRASSACRPRNKQERVAEFRCGRSQ